MGVAQPPHRRPGRTLYAYVAREALRPTLFALLGLTLVVLTSELLGFSDLVINRGLGVSLVGMIAFFEIVPMAASVLPFAALIGILVALGRLGADREVLVLEASGIAAVRLVGPVVALAAALAVLSGVLSVYGAPWANRSLDAALLAISQSQPWARFKAGTTSRFGAWQVEAREVSADGTSMRGVVLWMADVGDTVFAREGRVFQKEDGAIELLLENGTVLLAPGERARQVGFEEMRTELPRDTRPIARDQRDQILGFTLGQLRERAEAFERLESTEVPHAALEIQRRFALPVATLVFGFLAVPLFLARSRFSRSGGSVMGLLATLAYFALVQLGEGMVTGGRVPVWVGAWLPNAVMGGAALLLLGRARRIGVLGHDFGRPSTHWWSEGLAALWRRRSARRVKSDEPTAAPPRALRMSRSPLPRYVAGRFIQLSALSFAVLIAAYLLIDLMERLDWFTRHRATGVEVLRFYGARVWLLASRVVPMALLVGTSLTVSLLAVEGELIGMRACGISAPRALLPVFLISATVAPAYFLLDNVIVPRANALADELKRTEIKDLHYARRAREEDSQPLQRAAVWYRSGSQLVEAARFDPERGNAVQITIYETDADGLPLSRTDASGARYVGHGLWRLLDASRVVADNGHVRRVAPPRFAELGDAAPAEVDTMHMSVADLGREIDEVQESGYDVTPLRVDLHVKWARPLACLVLPSAVLFFAVGGPPFPGPAQTLLMSGILGVGYILLTGVSASIGYGGRVPSAVAGWAPTFGFAGLAVYYGLRLLRRL